jgi:hypothetical protein
MRQSLSQRVMGSRVHLCLTMALTLLLVLLGTNIVLADDEITVDWRGNLTCPSEHQVREGVIYCTGTDSAGHPVHVLVADLTVSSVRFEYIMPKGASDGHTGMQECHDPNVPEWGGPAKGCFVPSNRGLFPRIGLQEAVDRAVEVRSSPPVAAVINGDYGAPNGTHGPEGLIVVRRERLDGASRCDDDYNAALRPWLGLGEMVDPAIGRLQAMIDRLQTDNSPLPAWLYTGIGGGPWLVRDGNLYPGAANCDGDGRLDQITPVMNCTGRQKETPGPPKLEGYGPGSCRLAPHTAAGLSRDGRWLFLAISTGADHPGTLADFMRNQLGAWNALKFDGGGSSQLWFHSASPITVDPAGEKRLLSNYLALYAPPGQGIELPLQATPLERVYYKVLTTGETAEFKLQVRNAGEYSWTSEDSIELRSEPFFTLSPVVESLPPNSRVPPGETASWQWRAGSGSLTFRRFQMVQKGKPFGTDFAVVVITLPRGMEERRQELEEKIQEIIDEWKARGEKELDRLMRELQRLVERELEKLWERLITELMRKLDEICRSAMGSLSLVMVASMIAVIRKRGGAS